MMQPVADAVGEGRKKMRNHFQKKIWSPSFCPTSRFRMPGEMIAKFIQKLTSHIRQIIPQSRSKRVFCQQSEFSF